MGNSLNGNDTTTDANVGFEKINDNTALVTTTRNGKIYKLEMSGFTEENIETIVRLIQQIEEKLQKIKKGQAESK